MSPTNDYTILMQKNSEEKIYPASLTKMMTAIVAIENLPNLKQGIKLTNATFQGLYEADASMAGFRPGEQVKAIDLLYGVMLPSGAECCIGLDDQVAGSERSLATSAFRPERSYRSERRVSVHFSSYFSAM